MIQFLFCKNFSPGTWKAYCETRYINLHATVVKDTIIIFKIVNINRFLLLDNLHTVYIEFKHQTFLLYLSDNTHKVCGNHQMHFCLTNALHMIWDTQVSTYSVNNQSYHRNSWSYAHN